VVTSPVIAAGVVTTLVVQQGFNLLGLSFDLSWWLMLLSLNILACLISVLLGRLAQQPGEGAQTPSYPLASLALAVGVLASLALHVANLTIQIAGAQPIDADISVAAYIVDAAFSQAPDWIYLSLVLIACAGAWRLGLGAARGLRRRQTLDRDRQIYLTALLLFSLNTLFLQAWIEPPPNAAAITGIFWGAVALLAGALTLAVLLRFSSYRLYPFLQRLDLSLAAAAANGGGKFLIARELTIGLVLGLLWAIVALSMLALGVFLVVFAIVGLAAALAFMAALARDLLAWLVFALPWAGLACIAAGLTLIWRRSYPARGPDPGAAFTGWRLNTPPIWVFAAALACIAALSLGAVAGLFGAELLAWLSLAFNTAAPLVLAFVLFLALTQIVALAGVVVFSAPPAVAAMIKTPGLGAFLHAAGRTTAALAANMLAGLALISGGALVLFALVQLSVWVWTLLLANAGSVAASIALGLSIALLLSLLPHIAARMRQAWIWTEPRLRAIAPVALAIAIAISAGVAATPLYALLENSLHAAVPGLALAWDAVLSIVPRFVRPFIAAFAALALFTIAAAGAAAIAVGFVTGLGELGVNAARAARTRPRLIAGAAAAALLVWAGPTLLQRFAPTKTGAPQAQHEPPPPPRVTAIQRLVFEQGRWRFNSIYDVRSGAGSYIAIEAAIPDNEAAISPLCAHDAIVVAGAASGDGAANYNRVLAQCRALSVGAVLEQRLSRCQSRRPALLVMNLGVSSRPSASPADRIVAIAGVSDLPGPADAGAVSAALEAQPAQLRSVLGEAQSLSNYPDRTVQAFAGVGDCPRTWPRRTAGDQTAPAGPAPN
jgi:hypothetical protein